MRPPRLCQQAAVDDWQAGERSLTVILNVTPEVAAFFYSIGVTVTHVVKWVVQ